ncbi:Ubiquitin carboxyl-terminal hydrolase 14 [Geodia barretti]|uniref:Ubiquitin carboxyl-terminal hydrolase 14 n=1 Tax=Geodia barretti TaxID=519541 RepID=A0AA35RK51_GEOBA|nr:Ubiquitin carboxyl-terminal hydrolase 14 [Geodia barretti]
MYTAMRKGMEGTVKKKSAVLGRDADFKKTSPLSRLPGYLTVQFVRFSVGVAPDSGETVARKILKAQKAKLIAEGKLLGPKLAGAAAIAKKDENVEYEPFQFEDDPTHCRGDF